MLSYFILLLEVTIDHVVEVLVDFGIVLLQDIFPLLQTLDLFLLLAQQLFELLLVLLLLLYGLLEPMDDSQDVVFEALLFLNLTLIRCLETLGLLGLVFEGLVFLLEFCYLPFNGLNLGLALIQDAVGFFGMLDYHGSLVLSLSSCLLKLSELGSKHLNLLRHHFFKMQLLLRELLLEVGDSTLVGDGVLHYYLLVGVDGAGAPHCIELRRDIQGRTL